MNLKAERIQLPDDLDSDLLADVSCRIFIDFLKKEGYDITMRNPKHVPGQGYSPSPFYSNVNTDYVIADFIKQHGS